MRKLPGTFRDLLEMYQENMGSERGKELLKYILDLRVAALAVLAQKTGKTMFELDKMTYLESFDMFLSYFPNVSEEKMIEIYCAPDESYR